MSAIPIELSSSSAEASPARRADILWQEEIEQIRAAGPTMTPTAIACVRTVLETILHEKGLEPTIAASTRRLLDEISEQATRTGHDTTGVDRESANDAGRPPTTSRRRTGRRQLTLSR
jgi:hypothetical protein